MREIMDEVLKSVGYRITMAEDGLKAFDISKPHEREIALALLIMIMPHLDCAQFAGQTRSLSDL